MTDSCDETYVYIAAPAPKNIKTVNIPSPAAIYKVFLISPIVFVPLYLWVTSCDDVKAYKELMMLYTNMNPIPPLASVTFHDSIVSGFCSNTWLELQLVLPSAKNSTKTIPIPRINPW
ncbi:Uncharacterised protein, partial [Mycoplasmopsis synoviae]